MFRHAFLVLAVAVGAFAPPLHAETVAVAITGFAFVPATVNAAVGDTIEWTNLDFAPHTASKPGGAWTTGPIKNGGVGRFVVTEPGVFGYICQYHPAMKGQIVVTAAGGR